MPYSKYRMDSKSILDNIKCDFFIPKIFDFMQKNIALNIVKYNKILQKKLNITIKDFSDFKDLYLTKFINVYEYNKEYYHIYFNDNKEEVKNINILLLKKIKFPKLKYQSIIMPNR